MINHNYHFPRNLVSLGLFFSKARAPSPPLLLRVEERNGRRRKGKGGAGLRFEADNL